MSGNTIGSIVGGTIGFLVGGPQGAQIGFMIGGAIGGYVDPVKIKGPRLSDASQQTSQEGVPIPFGYGTFPCAGNIIWAGPLVEHKHKEGGKGGPQQITYTYTRSYAIGVCEGEISGLQKVKRNGKLVYDISPTSTIQGQNAKFLAKCTIYTGSETQLVDPVIEAVVGVGNTAPYRGLAYIVIEDDDLTDSAGAVAQYEFVVQKCGTVSNTLGQLFISTGQANKAVTSATGASWTDRTGGLSGVTLRFCAASATRVVAHDTTGQFWYSDDRGVTWTASATGAFGSLTLSEIAYGNGIFVALGYDGANFVAVVSADGGLTWAATVTALGNVNSIAYGAGLFVLAGYSNLYSSPTGTSWTLRSAGSFSGLGWNGTHFLACAVAATSSAWSTDGLSWTATAGALPSGPYAVTGGAGYFVCCAISNGVYRTTDLGASWTLVSTAGVALYTGVAGGNSIILGSGGGGGTVQLHSQDDGLTWAVISPNISDTSIAYMAPEATWYEIPDAPGAYADEDGVIQTAYIVGSEISSCGAYLDDIVADLCDRSGVATTEYDVTNLSGIFVKGYKCATEASAQSFLEPLTQAFFFDRVEYDKKLRFPLRGGANAFALTADDLVARDGPAIEQTRIQEVELLRRVNVMTVDPEAEYNQTKQSWERRAGTVIAKAESTVEIPITTDKDTAAGIAKKRGLVAWSETDKFKLGLSLKWSKLTPADVGTLTDKAGVVHRVRLVATNEESGVIEIEEAAKDRAAVYAATATGGTNGNTTTSNPGLVGHTLFAAMALPQLRSQDNTPGVYIGACGMLTGWTGCQILMSVDGGLSYQTVRTITEPTTMGFLTASCTTSSEPIAVRVFGGDLESKTFLQTGLGANWSAIESSGVAEIMAYETATSTGTVTYDLTDTYRGLDDTTAAAHASGDKFMDLTTAYFLPIPQTFAGSTLYFKAVGFGVSADAVDPVAVAWAGVTYIHDGGEVVP